MNKDLSLFEIVNTFFKDDERTKLWMKTPNPLLGKLSPNDLMSLGREKKLRLFVENQLNENGIG